MAPSLNNISFGRGSVLIILIFKWGIFNTVGFYFSVRLVYFKK